MADTIRSQDAFLNASTGLFKDNTAGDIGANDLRDFTLSTYRPQSFCNGRLTLETGVPVSTSDQTGKTTAYFTPYNGNLIGIYDGTSWTLRTFSELSLALGTLTSDKNYDIFVYDNSGTLTLEFSAAWTNDTTRADALTTQDGIYVKSGATTRRYLGTIRTTATTTTEDSIAKRFIWNQYNRVPRVMKAIDTTDSWSYTTASWRQANATTANRLEYVTGNVETMVEALVLETIAVGGGSGIPSVAIGVDSTSTPSGLWSFTYSGGNQFSVQGKYQGTPGLGYHALNWLEHGGNGATFYGDFGGDSIQAGIIGSLLA